ncbi:MAG: nickel pincer cofactor biosynthesis protein LarC [Nitrospinaceae bacterium]
MGSTKSRLAYFDCYSGISGDMILGALVDLGVDLRKIRDGLNTLDLPGYRIRSRRVRRGMISGTKVDVVLKKKSPATPTSRNFSDIRKLIQTSGLSGPVKSRSIEIFRRIARAEAKVHHTRIDKVHFHEVGAVDSIVDVVGGVLAIDLLDVQRIIASPLNVGEGLVDCQHGALPVPAPATLILLEGIPCFSSGVRKELTTPTGAGMIGFFARGFHSLPQMKILGSGYGAGDHIVEQSPNMLRVVLGEIEEDGKTETQFVVETNIDDMSPEFYDHVMESLFLAGAADVYFTPIIMKKNRPAVKISVLVPADKKDEISRILLSETSTFGVRFYPVNRITLDREIRTLKSAHGRVKVKLGILDGAIVHIAPEYEDCKKIARRKKLPIQTVYEEILSSAKRELA